MKFYNPVRIFDEYDCVKNHAKELASFGSKALVVTGKSSSFSNGSFDDVKSVLETACINYTVFSEVEENPSVETVFKAKDRYSSEGIGFVIGIGGGSPMDAAKAIALVLKHPEADLDYLYDASRNSSSLPVVCVPTTCGTGSEVTGVAVLTRHDKKTKISMTHKVFPSLALVDGKYLESASDTLVANSSVDALSHLLESALNARSDDYVKMTATAGLSTWAKTKDILTGHRKALPEDRALLMRASVLGGMSIAGCGTSLPHALSYILTYDLGLTHGRAVGYFLPGFVAAAPAKERDELLKYAGFSDVNDFEAFISDVFGQQEIPEAELIRAFETVKNNPAKMRSASFEVDEKMLKKIVFG